MIKVIIADDEENVCQLIRGLIDWASLDMEIVGIAHNGVEALDKVEKLLPDLMITDIRMPGYDGLEMIRRATNIKQDLDFIIISGYHHFEYAQNAIKYGVSDYLLKPIRKEDFLASLNKMRDRYLKRTERLNNEEQLKKRLKNDVNKLRTGLFTERLLKKGMTTQDLTIEEVNESYHYAFQPGLFQVCAVKIDCGFEDEYNNTIQILEETIMRILNTQLKELCFDMEMDLDDSITYCVLNYGPENRKTVRKQIKAVFDELMVQKTSFEQHDFTISAGSVVEDVGELKESFRAARYAVGQRLIEGTGRLIEDVTVHKDPQRVDVLLAELNKTMGAAVEVLKKDAVLNCITGLKKQIETENLSGAEIFSLVKHVCEMYLLHLRNNQIQIQYGQEFYEKFCIHAARCSSIDRLFEYLSVMVGESMEVIIEEKEQADTRPIRVAKEYIQENFSKPITLEEVSGIVGFNPTYFSTLFKKETGNNFVNYLSEIRMNRAKELLRESNLTVAAICEQVGYSDLKNFTKGFTKSVGLKPNEYRKLYS
ncbi:response regulator [Clostridium sp. KNHs216]|uniref:response regulator transcription factor n=1 Tax=Clostridium sp. KNHs216 TaxID=1550235 RepID=UPI001152DE1C|nr:response regulator [Clostridium sp. KNHs216]TQI66463.1 two-component system response regulator YesN [Clostridium sp. KNHs216]